MDFAAVIPPKQGGIFAAPSSLLFRKKPRLLRLWPCKRGHNASAALPLFCGCWCRKARIPIVSVTHVGGGFAQVISANAGFFALRYLLLFRKRARQVAPRACKCARSRFAASHFFAGTRAVRFASKPSAIGTFKGYSSSAKSHAHPI